MIQAEQAFVTVVGCVTQRDGLRCTKGATLSADGLEVSNTTTFSPAIAVSVEPQVSFTVAITECERGHNNGMLLGFTDMDLDVALQKIEEEDCDAFQLSETWCLNEENP
eukprot:GEMP01059358.1.p2 GENE.GEMP01059358.1~~GEMP01059358.1.p2  ORF type:complete len:109 (+),score=14.39 GEMP01059358.1:48-374(+)